MNKVKAPSCFNCPLNQVCHRALTMCPLERLCELLPFIEKLVFAKEK